MLSDNNGEPVDWRMPLDAGTELSSLFQARNSTYVPQKKSELELCFSKTIILFAVLKPAGIATHPDGPGKPVR